MIAYNSVLVSVGILIEFVCVSVFSISNKKHCFRSTEVTFHCCCVGRRGTFLSEPISNLFCVSENLYFKLCMQ